MMCVRILVFFASTVVYVVLTIRTHRHAAILLQLKTDLANFSVGM